MAPTVRVAKDGSKPTAKVVAAKFRRALKNGGSAEYASGVQWFFKDAITLHGWYTADLRRATVRFRRELRKERGLDFVVEIADQLFSGQVLEEKVAAVSCWKGLMESLATGSSPSSNRGSIASAVGRIMMDWYIL
ncbi:MAG TPA: DNA alkylation repair protein [Candidatus Sulfotelmatobacter sp.]|jgi:hypothetical protein